MFYAIFCSSSIILFSFFFHFRFSLYFFGGGEFMDALTVTHPSNTQHTDGYKQKQHFTCTPLLTHCTFGMYVK